MRTSSRLAPTLIAILWGTILWGTILWGGSKAAVAQWAPIPPPRHEMLPPPPGPGMIWQRGAWDWDGRGYVWRPGHYITWPHRHHRWIPGHWARRGVWVPAHWR